MPITVQWPTSGDPFGPGFNVLASTNFIGPLPSDSFWTIQLTAPANENMVCQADMHLNVKTINMLMTNALGSSMSPAEAFPYSVGGVSGQLRVILQTPSTSFEEHTDVPIVMDRQTGQVPELKAWIGRQGVGAGEGLTLEEHDALLATQLAVTADIGPGLGDLIQTIGGLITRPPMGIGSLSSPAYELEGDGEIPDIGDLLHSRFGLYWVATVIPPGLGHLHGQTEEYLQRLVQFRTVHAIDSVELVTEVLDANYHGALWAWATAKPQRVEYSILPGVHLQVRWWQFP